MAVRDELHAAGIAELIVDRSRQLRLKSSGGHPPEFFRAQCMLRRLGGVALCALMSLASVPSAAQQITIGKGNCATGVRLTAKGARLSEVLKKLSQTLEFQLQFDSSNDPIVNIDMSRRAPELIAKLSPADNIMVTQAPDPKCPRQYRVVKVWVLPTAKANVGAPTPGAAARPAATPQASQPYTPAQLDEMSRQRKAAYDTYVREHGEPPPPDPD